MKIKLPEFNSARVLVVGDVMLDRYWSGPTGRISPEAPVPVVKVEHNEERPGGAANVALNAAALGAGARLLGLTGNDEAADALQERMLAVGVDCDFVRHATHPTITKLRVMSRNQQLLRLDFENGFNADDAVPLTDKHKAALSDAGVVVLSDYAKGALARVQELIKAAAEAGVPVLVDPKGTEFEKYRGATLLTPNMSEFEAVVGKVKDEQELVERGRELVKRFELQALLVTRSEHGMTLIRREEGELHLPARAHEVYDVTGAGDTVIATLATSLAAGLNLEEACALANVAAGIVVGKLGTSTVSAIELANALYGAPESGMGVVSEQQLKFVVEAARRRGEKIVMTNGCFDILHAGHVSYLNNARKLGDRLIVAVNTDESVRALKGEGRPVNTVERRMAVLEALGAVDWVVPFAEDTPQRLIAGVLPDILVKGGDYKPEDIAGYAEVTANGGEVTVLNFEDGCSTTAIIEAIRTR
ncbi:bifunctional D-glycero-beta-D-manno-heptose-7-phosphate kinase/D-glycero-beta-D-manno-heptose 1-phosphate adenylyltransferase HldE [Oceanimonas baumannii]|uniref:bifunctional D-glycero-beta-D-manno-heptose-7-phosphate kinase/D-glycero-beta-D-manno-heptose 1-phosphate adenylyltransferase HldE n=1 Tax=Oceanimonas baumannii TaxID=129578 RepID=UPI001D18FA65|nr:bifunctional D-glycero-beta-D-manno-heptose-7-phosphate kinase/D-glycero-beta-D-manno-heptose 1-phosphate adenylyltransferase HldE [Oceanimonas baumannii]MCC4263995.1 bifunctional D-glycero-beta-D-manno-heptose-7-phosphate kinase/D-glycero-beta-D-manno-heptose 1-phosphate adenylyltransferase HldE [Oceanimonas baumannii]